MISLSLNIFFPGAGDCAITPLWPSPQVSYMTQITSPNFGIGIFRTIRVFTRFQTNNMHDWVSLFIRQWPPIITDNILAQWISNWNHYLVHFARFPFKIKIIILLVYIMYLRGYEERRARGAAAGSAREEVVTKPRRIRMRNRCSFFPFVIPFERAVLTALTAVGDR